LSSKEYVAPRNETEAQLAAIWQELLGVDKVGIHDNFFELGGHSLLIIKLVSFINDMFSTDVSINLVFEYTTISEFVDKMYSVDHFKKNIMVPLREKGSRKALYLTPPGSGTVNCFIELTKQLGKDQPVYAFQCSGLYGESPILKSIEEMASVFIAEMQKKDPYGPYRLGGYSFGATIAYEMALQLRNNGFEVDELLIFDGRVSFEDNSEMDEDKMFREFLKKQTGIFGEDFNFSDLAIEDKSKEEQLETVSKLLRESEFKISDQELKGRLEVNFYNENCSYLNKVEDKLNAKVILFKTTYAKMDGKIIFTENDIYEFDYGWNKYTNKEVLVHSIATTHDAILDRENVEQICSFLNSKNNS
ncbi:thioesterase domain-containing protein, partial [Flavobacterium sp. W22_SRS_FK3]|uniref:thioesterase domain-containing protein n=1 Tax=Flavobacterium sp. W22_SRS_FK3 TaxID=3240275 RepID=UPI003F918948